MAIATLTDSSLRLEFDNGIDGNTGKKLTKAKSFNNVKITATSEQLYTVAQAIVGLQQLSLLSIERKDSSNIVEE
ncbi:MULTISPECIES: DUF1659 domain-containing protein [Virgibacillus]|uniref:DUF1659 domain-containing protein n=1 Tax=Virgibacillus dokdonensis TaxID=302167 RepID=A0ABU7VJN9_9BACI|nr:DUF1659 domain-containing protein [Virgibacillus sp.]NWO14449.1 DUF1659 domain-containing protein [Virgibacillus sp.]